MLSIQLLLQALDLALEPLDLAIVQQFLDFPLVGLQRGAMIRRGNVERVQVLSGLFTGRLQLGNPCEHLLGKYLDGMFVVLQFLLVRRSFLVLVIPFLDGLQECRIVRALGSSTRLLCEVLDVTSQVDQSLPCLVAEIFIVFLDLIRISSR